MIAKDVTLKFKTFMIEMRKKHNYTQDEVAKGLRVSRSTYIRMENIGSSQKITLEQSRDVFEFYNVQEGFREILTYLEPTHRNEIIERIALTMSFLEDIDKGTINFNEIKTIAKDLRTRYANTHKVLSAVSGN